MGHIWYIIFVRDARKNIIKSITYSTSEAIYLGIS